MVYMEPKYHEETALYKRSTRSGSNPWEPGQLCVMPHEVIAQLPEPRRCDMQAVLLGIARVENQVFDMMGGMNGY